MKAIYYDQTTGIITKAIEATDEIVELNKGPNEAILEGDPPENINEYMVVGGVVQKKPAMPISVSSTTISGIPTGTEVLIPNEPPYIVDTGSVTLNGNYPQAILVTLQHPQYLAATVTVTI